MENRFFGDLRDHTKYVKIVPECEGKELKEENYAPIPKVDYNEKMIRQQYEPMTPKEQYDLKMEALDEIRKSGVDYCSCPQACPHHGKCWECVLIHRGHRDHLPYCFWDMVNEKLYAMERLTEGSMKQWKPHEEGKIPKQNPCPPEV